MNIKKLVFILLAAIGLLQSGCVTTTITKDGEIAALTKLMDENTDPKDIVSDQGLTKKGYSMLFPGMDPSQHIAEWQGLSVDEKVSYIQANSSPAIRLFWESARRKALQENCEWKNAGASPEKIDQEIEKCVNEDPYEAVRACANKARANEDTCILTHAEIASEDEMDNKGQYVYARELVEQVRMRKIAQLR